MFFGKMIIKQNNKMTGTTMDCFKGTVSSSNNADNRSDRNPPAMSGIHDTPITSNPRGTNKIILTPSPDSDLQHIVKMM